MVEVVLEEVSVSDLEEEEGEEVEPLVAGSGPRQCWAGRCPDWREAGGPDTPRY